MSIKVSVAELIPEYQLILEQKSKILSTITDVSRFAKKGSKSVSYPKLAARTAQVVAFGATLTPAGANWDEDLLLLDKIAASAWPISVHDEEQNIFSNTEENIRGSLSAMALKIDVEIYNAMIASLATAGENVVPTSDMYADVVALNQKLDEKNVPEEGRILLIKPSQKATLLKTKDFVQFNSNGSGQAISTGVIGTILGATVVCTNAVSGDAVMYHPLMVAFAYQSDAKYLEAAIPNSMMLSASISQIFGLKVTQDGSFGVRLGDNPLP